MDPLLVVLLVAVAIGVTVAVLRARQAAARKARADAPRADPFADAHGNEELLYSLGVGAVVSYHNSDFLVRGSLRFDEDGYRWAEHLISDGTAQHWLSVEDDEGLSVVLWDRVEPGTVTGEPGADTVTHAGDTYRLQERGRASFTADGTTGTATQGTAEYADYAADGGAQLSFERFGSAWEVSVGRSVLPRTLNIYPSSS